MANIGYAHRNDLDGPPATSDMFVCPKACGHLLTSNVKDCIKCGAVVDSQKREIVSSLLANGQNTDQIGSSYRKFINWRINPILNKTLPRLSAAYIYYNKSLLDLAFDWGKFMTN